MSVCRNKRKKLREVVKKLWISYRGDDRKGFDPSSITDLRSAQAVSCLVGVSQSSRNTVIRGNVSRIIDSIVFRSAHSPKYCSLISGTGWGQSGSWVALGSCRSWWWWRGARCWWTAAWTWGSMPSTFGRSWASTRGRRGCWSNICLAASWERWPGLWTGSDETIARDSNELNLKWNETQIRWSLIVLKLYIYESCKREGSKNIISCTLVFGYLWRGFETILIVKGTFFKHVCHLVAPVTLVAILTIYYITLEWQIRRGKSRCRLDLCSNSKKRLTVSHFEIFVHSGIFGRSAGGELELF